MTGQEINVLRDTIIHAAPIVFGIMAVGLSVAPLVIGLGFNSDKWAMRLFPISWTFCALCVIAVGIIKAHT